MDRDSDVNREKLVLNYMISIYENELYWLLSAIKSNCEKLFEIAKVPETGYVIQVDFEAHSLIKSIVNNAAQVANLIDPRPKMRDEDKARYEFRKKRGDRLKGIFNGINVKIMLDRTLRNSIEHFDERLDNLVRKVSKSASKKVHFLSHNMVLSDKAVMNPFPTPISVYVSSGKIFYNMAWTFNIGEIYDVSKLMLQKMETLEAFTKIKDSGGLLVIIPRII